MKKSLMILASVALGASMAVGQDVESKNVVGFNTVTLPANKYAAVGWQFALVGGATNIPIASITNYPSPTASTFGFNFADNIRKWNANGTYSNYYRYSLSKWCENGKSVITTDEIKLGESVMFYKRTTASTLTEAGEVVRDNVVIPATQNAYTFMCNPFPIEIEINSITNYTSPTASTFGYNFADNIRKWIPSSGVYSNYYRHNLTQWRRVSGPAEATTDVMAPGEGFMFYKRTTAGQVTFATPIP